MKCAVKQTSAHSPRLAPWQPLDPRGPPERAELASSGPPLPWLRSRRPGRGGGADAAHPAGPAPTAAVPPRLAAGPRSPPPSPASPPRPARTAARARPRLASTSFSRLRLCPQSSVSSPPREVPAPGKKPRAGWPRRHRCTSGQFSLRGRHGPRLRSSRSAPAWRPGSDRERPIDSGSSSERGPGCGEEAATPRDRSRRLLPSPATRAPRLRLGDATACPRGQRTPAADARWRRLSD